MSNPMFHGFKRTLGKLAGASVSKMGDIIIFTTVASWMASSAAQIYGIAVNKNYTHDQKKYMINQEVFDAITNICYSIKNLLVNHVFLLIVCVILVYGNTIYLCGKNSKTCTKIHC